MTLDVSYVPLEDPGDLPDDVRQCLAYWQDLRGGRFAPAWSEFDWIQIPSAVIPQIGVVDVHRDPLDFVYRYWGSAHVELHDQELTGKSVREMQPEAESHSVFRQYEETLNARRPAVFENRIMTAEFSVPKVEVSLRLLFSDDGETVHQLMAVSDVRKDFDALKDAFGE